MTTLAVSHSLLATENVDRITDFFSQAFEIEPHFRNTEFSEFVLPSGFRVAFFLPIGKTKNSFDLKGTRSCISFGITVTNVDEFFLRFESLQAAIGGSHQGPPKTHPWGEKSFLMFDPDGNRWEVTESPSANGMLVTR